MQTFRPGMNFACTEFSDVAQKTQRAGDLSCFGRTALTMADLGLVELYSVDSKGVVLRTVAEYLAGVTQIESLEAVIRDAVGHGEANPIWSIHALTQEIAQIARAHERAEILIGAHGPGGFVGAGVRSYPDRHAREPGFDRVAG